MSAFMHWFRFNGGARQFGSRRSRGLERYVLALERLEPRQLLAGDLLGVLDAADLSWQPESPAAEQATIDSPSPGHVPEVGAFHAGQDLSSPELVYLEQLAADLGEIVELDSDEFWWCDDCWYDIDPI
jgi:hypothetical protein